MSYQRIEFKETGGTYYSIGDHAWAEVSYQGSPFIRTIPRASGVKIYSTDEMGGGYTRIAVHAWVKKTTRKLLEQYFLNLPINIGKKTGTLKISGTEYSGCSMSNITADSSYHKWAFFSVEFVRSI